jgi:hypothetical protein
MLFSVYTKIRNCRYMKPNTAAGRTWIQVENYSYSEIHGWQEIAALKHFLTTHCWSFRFINLLLLRRFFNLLRGGNLQRNACAVNR